MILSGQLRACQYDYELVGTTTSLAVQSAARVDLGLGAVVSKPLGLVGIACLYCLVDLLSDCGATQGMPHYMSGKQDAKAAVMRDFFLAGSR